jgi:hypothetical protein
MADAPAPLNAKVRIRPQWPPSGQLVAYSTAIETRTGKPVTESWLLLPVSGAGIRIVAHAL